MAKRKTSPKRTHHKAGKPADVAGCPPPVLRFSGSALDVSRAGVSCDIDTTRNALLEAGHRALDGLPTETLAGLVPGMVGASNPTMVAMERLAYGPGSDGDDPNGRNGA